MSNLAVVQQTNIFSLTPRSLEEAMKFSDIMSKSSIVPKHYQGKAADILVAVQMGSEIGLKPMQSLQNIAVINGKPSVYGDALIALVQVHPEFENIIEYFDEKLQAAICTLKRRNQSEHTVIYSIEDAKKASLWNKVGPWQQYPKRMLQMRARGFALRDKFADALGGLISAEEAQDYPIDITPKSENQNIRIEETRIINDHDIENKRKEELENINKEIDFYVSSTKTKIISCKDLEELKNVFIEAQRVLKGYFPSDHAANELNKIALIKDEAKEKLEKNKLVEPEQEKEPQL
jgi:hypothetical protein